MLNKYHQAVLDEHAPLKAEYETLEAEYDAICDEYELKPYYRNRADLQRVLVESLRGGKIDKRTFKQVNKRILAWSNADIKLFTKINHLRFSQN